MSAVLENHPTLACPEGHEVPQPDAQVGEVLAAAVSDQLVTARRTRLRRTLRCGSCEAEITMPGRRTTRSVSELVADLGVVRLVLDVPMLRCSDCGIQQIPEEVRGDVAEVITRLLIADGPAEGG